jgi:hypothetical protein
MAPSMPTPYRTSVGYCLFVFEATPNAYCQINEQLHTFFLFLLFAILELYGFELQHFINSKHKFLLLMKKEQMGYLAPEIEVNEICVEHGFAGSDELNRIGFGNSGEAGGEIETLTQTEW